ncbi:MAG: translation initiation factor IF-2 [Coriobacteriia bacterium]|nr:translation initiation factor IF-2 [Coriobacteriia bacterium]
MAGMRVHELAKEFDMSSKDLLSRLAEMKIPAKSHASILSEANIEKVRQNLSPEDKERAGKLEEEEAKQLAEEKAKAAAAKAAEEAERRAAAEAEREAREAERARREAKKTEKAPRKVSNSPFESLASQLEREQARLERERKEAEERRVREARAREVAKKQAVEEALHNRNHKHNDKPASAKPAPKPKKAAPTSTSNFSSLLDQIKNEEVRLKNERKEAAANKRAGGGNANAGTRGKNKGARHGFEPVVPELEQNQQGEDRYAQMAIHAEEFQRDKVLAEARAAVEAAQNTKDQGGRRKKRKEKREAEKRQKIAEKAIEHGIDPTLVLDESVVEVPQGSTVAQLAELLEVTPNDIVKRLFMMGEMMTLTQSMSDELIELVADDLGRKVRVVSPEEEYAVVYNDTDADLMPRPPVVTVMGHVDHGKTSLLDAIRHTGVAEGEAGGITQHIGASVININNRQITFIDTPGHEAFTAMRARGAQVTDVIVLVVAADDGVMPQTVEAINHAKAANVPIVVAVNKIDKPGATPDRVRQELTEHGVIPEEWGGQNMFVDVSARQRINIDELLETILLQADILELKANPNAEASGFVIEANLDRGRGSVATVLVSRGTLHPGDMVVAGTSYGKVRALINPKGEHVDKAVPADPVEILGLNSVPVAGDEFRVFEDERDARHLAEERALRARLKQQENRAHMSLDDLFNQIEEGKTTDLNLIVKADVAGSIEALRDSFSKMDQTEVRINIVHAAVGGITETDVTLAAASNAIIIGFNVRPTGKTREVAEREGVDIRLYRVIYQAIEDINAARVGLLSPDIVEEDTGIAEVRETFRVPKVGVIAGCYVTEGEIHRDDKVRIVRDGTVIYEGTIDSLRRFKDDVKSVARNYECGIGIAGYQDIHIGDTIEGYRVVEVERTE